MFTIINFDHAIVWDILIVLLIIIFIIIYRQYTLQHVNKLLNIKVQEELDKSKHKDKMIFQQRKLISMGEMIENIAHQWRQPLSQVNSAVLIIDDIMDEKNFKDSIIEEKLLEIESLTKYMSKTIDDFKNFFDKNTIEEKFSLNELIEKSVYIVRGSLKSHNIEVDISIDSNYYLQGLPNELQQVFVVILNNAKDMFLTRNILKPKITISVKQEDDFYKICISDNAGGIKDTIIDKIFEPYFTTKHKSQGTGLGLYISKVIIEERMHGMLNVLNTNNGANFEIILKAHHE